MFHPLNERFAIGSVADSESLKQIAESGYRTVIDLCTPVEGNQLNPEENEEQADGIGDIEAPVLVGVARQLPASLPRARIARAG